VFLAAGIANLDFHEMQKAYYTKYIDAGGVAIVPPEHVKDISLRLMYKFNATASAKSITTRVKFSLGIHS